MPFWRNRTNAPDQFIVGNDSQETKPDERISYQPAQNKIFILADNDFIKTRNSLVKLGTDTTNQGVIKRWHHP